MKNWKSQFSLEMALSIFFWNIALNIIIAVLPNVFLHLLKIQHIVALIYVNGRIEHCQQYILIQWNNWRTSVCLSLSLSIGYWFVSNTQFKNSNKHTRLKCAGLSVEEKKNYSIHILTKPNRIEKVIDTLKWERERERAKKHPRWIKHFALNHIAMTFKVSHRTYQSSIFLAVSLTRTHAHK